MSDERRRHFRLRYPISVRPPIEIDGNVFSVVDLSEGGLKFHGSRSTYPAAGTNVVGKIQFSDGTRAEVRGQMVRVTVGGDCVLQLTQGVPLARMMDEPRNMIRKHRI